MRTTVSGVAQIPASGAAPRRGRRTRPLARPLRACLTGVVGGEQFGAEPAELGLNLCDAPLYPLAVEPGRRRLPW